MSEKLLVHTQRFREQVLRAWRAVVWYVKGVMGESDYDTYCAHLRRRHPDEPLPTVSEYWRKRYADEDAHPSARCC
ncbi:MAG: YbdD/YjiX family protein [Propionibacteriaceae bacterium]|jgi:uncharacterized short protein YbdD (DUF466 family)|nr:YbdD/YjiX family protein [Propionibacteriaceae bacterium]